MDLKRELFINERQPVYGLKDTYMENFFQAVIDDCNKYKGGTAGNPCLLMSQAFTYGMIWGKRAERARRKRNTRENGSHVNQIINLLNKIDRTDYRFLNQIYTIIKLHLEKEKEGATYE